MALNSALMGLIAGLPFYILFGALCFTSGAIYQQHVTYRSIEVHIENEPYMHFCKLRIYKALRFLGIQEADEAGAKTDGKFKSIVRFITDQTETLLHKLSLGFLVEKEEKEVTIAARIDDIMKYGFPSVDDIHVYKNFVLSYNRRIRIANWVCEHLHAENLAMNSLVSDLSAIDFSDDDLPAKFRTNRLDYRSTIFQTGRLAAPKNYQKNLEFYYETFVSTNSVPISQRPLALLLLEDYVRELLTLHDSLYVYSGPIFIPQRLGFRNWIQRYQVIGINIMAVPTHFFKVIIYEVPAASADGVSVQMEGYVVPNATLQRVSDIKSYAANISDIEHFSGLKFYERAG